MTFIIVYKIKIKYFCKILNLLINNHYEDFKLFCYRSSNA